jgi:hypothetical protein
MAETRNPKEIRMPKSEMILILCVAVVVAKHLIRTSDFGFPSLRPF